MKLPHPRMAALVLTLSVGTSTALDFFETSVYAPRQPQIDGKPVHANGQAFVVGAAGPSTRCGLRDAEQCPPGAATLVNADMTMLGAAVPGGQVVYVLPDGSITYSLPHTGSRPPVPQGRFFSFQAVDARDNQPLTVLSWRSTAGAAGLWVCPSSAPGTPGTGVGARMGVLKAATAGFRGDGCVAVGGLRMRPAGSAYGAWEYT